MNGKPEKPDRFLFYKELIAATYRDASKLLTLRSSSSDRDLLTINERLDSEGLSFLTKTLPALGKCLDKALGSECPFPNGHSFELSKRAPFLPKFLAGYWEVIFDSDGRVRTSERGSDEELRQIEAVRAVRQICYLAYKLELPYTPEQEARVYEKFQIVDASLPDVGALTLSQEGKRALDNARLLLWYVFEGMDPYDIVPKHGPGAVATGEKPWEKMNFSRIFSQLEGVYPFTDYYFLNYSHLCDELQSLDNLECIEDSTAKVVLVPKDSRGPRLISMEPLELQWLQQGLMTALVRKIETDSPSAGYVNFTDQNINRSLAEANSYHGEFVTLDMEDASDRVSLALVESLMPEPLLTCLRATRSTSTLLPSGTVMPLKKFAPMGSAVCFPVEAIIFWAIAVGSVRDIRKRSDLSLLPSIYVYGDDIIARKSDYEAFRPVFEEVHLRFNEGKCCTGRFFRESCGKDAFKLGDVTPLRAKTLWDDRSSLAAALSYVSMSNAFRERGYTLTADFLQKSVTESFGAVPTTCIPHTHQYAFTRRDWSNAEIEKTLFTHFKSRWNKRYQRWEVRVPIPQSRVIERGAPGWSEMLRLWHRMDSSKDPFGFGQASLRPCSYTCPHQVNLRWKWQAIELLVPRGM